jgi:hypothetical protein
VKIIIFYSLPPQGEDSDPGAAVFQEALQVPDDFNFYEDKQVFYRYLAESGQIRITRRHNIYLLDRDRAAVLHRASLRQRFAEAPNCELVEVVLPDE